MEKATFCSHRIQAGVVATSVEHTTTQISQTFISAEISCDHELIVHEVIGIGHIIYTNGGRDHVQVTPPHPIFHHQDPVYL
jgi:hypothetical protein